MLIPDIREFQCADCDELFAVRYEDKEKEMRCPFCQSDRYSFYNDWDISE